MRIAALAVTLLLSALGSGLTETSASETGTRSPGPVTSSRQESYRVTWKWQLDHARKVAQQSRFGILYYFPPKGSSEDHSLFESETVIDFYQNHPMVKIQGPEHESLRREYGIHDRLHTLVVTDWYGNPIRKPFVARSTREKFPEKKILSVLDSADQFVTQTRMLLAKKLKSGNRNLERKKWRGAIKDLTEVATLKGYPESIEAREQLELVVEEGRQEIKKAKRMDREAALKALKRIKKDFKGTVIEDDAELAMSELG